VTDLVSKKVTTPPGTGAVQGTRAVKMEMSPPPAAVPRVPDLGPRKRKAIDELGRDRTVVMFSNPLILLPPFINIRCYRNFKVN